MDHSVTWLDSSSASWVRDDQAQGCMVCSTRFSSFLPRKHHCRKCGWVICNPCSLHVTQNGASYRVCRPCGAQLGPRQALLRALSASPNKRSQLPGQQSTSSSSTLDLHSSTTALSAFLFPGGENDPYIQQRLHLGELFALRGGASSAVRFPRSSVSVISFQGSTFQGAVFDGLLRDADTNSQHDVAATALLTRALVRNIDALDMAPEHREACVLEARALATINHDSVLEILGFVEDSVAPAFLVITEHHLRGTLHDYLIDPANEIPVPELLRAAAQIGGAVHHLHTLASESESQIGSQHQLLLGCISSHGVVVCGRSPLVVKLAELGVARSALLRDLATRPSARWICGDTCSLPNPLRWMAPEVLLEGTFSVEGDVWSLGVFVWELLSAGALPHASVDSSALAEHLASGGHLEAPKYAAGIYPFLLKMCCVDALKRPGIPACIEELRRRSLEWESLEISKAARSPVVKAIVSQSLGMPGWRRSGRDEMIKEIRRLFEEDCRDKSLSLQVLRGTKGSGRGTTLRDYARSYVHLYPHGQLHVDASSTWSMTESVRAILVDSLGQKQYKDASWRFLVAALHRHLHDNAGWLLVLEDADMHSAIASILPPLTSHGHILMSSTLPESAFGPFRISVPLLLYPLSMEQNLALAWREMYSAQAVFVSEADTTESLSTTSSKSQFEALRSLLERIGTDHSAPAVSLLGIFLRRLNPDDPLQAIGDIRALLFERLSARSSSAAERHSDTALAAFAAFARTNQLQPLLESFKTKRPTSLLSFCSLRDIDLQEAGLNLSQREAIALHQAGARHICDAVLPCRRGLGAVWDVACALLLSEEQPAAVSLLRHLSWLQAHSPLVPLDLVAVLAREPPENDSLWQLHSRAPDRFPQALDAELRVLEELRVIRMVNAKCFIVPADLLSAIHVELELDTPAAQRLSFACLISAAAAVPASPQMEESLFCLADIILERGGETFLQDLEPLSLRASTSRSAAEVLLRAGQAQVERGIGGAHRGDGSAYFLVACALVRLVEDPIRAAEINAALYAGLSSVHFLHGAFVESLKYAKMALNLSSSEITGAQSISHAVARSRHGLALSFAGQYTRGCEEVCAALAAGLEMLGEDHADLSPLYVNAGLACTLGDEALGARSHFQRASDLAADETIMSPFSMACLADTFLRLRQPLRAVKRLARAMSVWFPFHGVADEWRCAAAETKRSGSVSSAESEVPGGEAVFDAAEELLAADGVSVLSLETLAFSFLMFTWGSVVLDKGGRLDRDRAGRDEASFFLQRSLCLSFRDQPLFFAAAANARLAQLALKDGHDVLARSFCQAAKILVATQPGLPWARGDTAVTVAEVLLALKDTLVAETLVLKLLSGSDTAAGRMDALCEARAVLVLARILSGKGQDDEARLRFQAAHDTSAAILLQPDDAKGGGGNHALAQELLEASKAALQSLL